MLVGTTPAFHPIQECNMHITAVAPRKTDVYIGDVPEAPALLLGGKNFNDFRHHTSGLIANIAALLVLQQCRAEARQCHV